MGFFWIPDLGSRIPNPYSLKIGQKFFFSISKINNLQFCEICGYKKGLKKKFFPPLSLVEVFGSGIQDSGSGIQDPGRVIIRIRDKHPGSATLFLRVQHSLT
jgi:hypothetical protein